MQQPAGMGLSGAVLFDGYFNDPETTQARLAGGGYQTRDLGFMRDGELYVLGRKDDLLIVNGRNLHAHQVEALIGGVAGVKPGRAVAFGIYNEEIGSEELVVIAERDPAGDSTFDQALSRAVRRAVYEQTNIEVKICRIVNPGWLVKTTSGILAIEKAFGVRFADSEIFSFACVGDLANRIDALRAAGGG